MEDLELSWIETPAKESDMIVGTKIRYKTDHYKTKDFFLKIGVIKSITDGYFQIEWDEKELNSHNFTMWIGSNHFNILFPSLKSSITVIAEANQAAINDHICPTCSNNRCSKNEKTCWKCGNPL